MNDETAFRRLQKRYEKLCTAVDKEIAAGYAPSKAEMRRRYRQLIGGCAA